MKRCPKCYQVYGNTETFCEVDGQRLLPDPGLKIETTELVPDGPPSRNLGPLAIGLVGVFMGVFLCGGAYVAYSFLSSASNNQEERPPLAVQVQEQPQTRPAPPRVAEEAESSPSESPAEEEQAEASPEPSQQTPVEPVSARLNQGPVSTGDQSSGTADGAKVKTIIEMQDGSSVEVDAAWKDNQGVWYRQGSLVSFVDGARVKAITARAEPKSSPAGNQ
jgi:cytoskeletal protein RodZ